MITTHQICAEKKIYCARIRVTAWHISNQQRTDHETVEREVTACCDEHADGTQKLWPLISTQQIPYRTWVCVTASVTSSFLTLGPEKSSIKPATN